MARITLFPLDGDASINGKLAQNVDFSGIDPTIHCVQWYDTSGWVEYDADLVTGSKPPNLEISSIAPYQAYVNSAQVIIDAYLNPLIVYSTQNDLLFGDVTYTLGDKIAIYTPNPQPPAQSTDEDPPTPQDFQQLFWYVDELTWVVSPFDPSLTLPNAKNLLIEKVQTSGAGQVDYQSRIYSMLQMGASTAGTLPTTDYSGLDLSGYQTYIDGEVAAMTATINAATTTTQLYTFDWRVEGDPNA